MPGTPGRIGRGDSCVPGEPAPGRTGFFGKSEKNGTFCALPASLLYPQQQGDVMPGNNAHDQFFRSVFRDPDNARDFLRTVLPRELAAALDLREIRFEQESHIRADLAARYSDLVLRVRLAGGGEAAVYILLEHKSAPDAGVFLQIMEYQLAIWQKDRAAGRPLRAIIPLVFYHGRKKWDLPSCFEEQFPEEEELLPYLPKYRYLLFDTAGWEETQNPELRSNVFLLTSLLLFKNVFRMDIPRIRKIFALWAELGYINKRDKLFIELRYIVQKTTIPEQELGALLTETIREKEGIMPTIAEQWIAEGKVKGILLEKQETLIRLLERKFGIMDADRARITACTDRERLTAALDMILDATSAAGVLSLLD
jgi:predicted transposase/invertase (TIGR01784 family)